MILTRLSCWLGVGGWGLTEEEGGGNTGSHRRRTGWEEGGIAFSFSQGSRKERKEAKARQRSPNQLRRDGWRGEGLEQERCLLVGCGSLAGWIDLARVELHHLPCISLFFSRPGEVDSYDAHNNFFFWGGDYSNTKGYKITNSDEVSSLQLRGYTLLRRITQWKSRGKLERSLCWDTKYFFWPRRYAALQNWWLQDRNSSGPDYFFYLFSNIICHSFIPLATGNIHVSCSEASFQRS